MNVYPKAIIFNSYQTFHIYQSLLNHWFSPVTSDDRRPPEPGSSLWMLPFQSADLCILCEELSM